MFSLPDDARDQGGSLWRQPEQEIHGLREAELPPSSERNEWLHKQGVTSCPVFWCCGVSVFLYLFFFLILVVWMVSSSCLYDVYTMWMFLPKIKQKKRPNVFVSAVSTIFIVGYCLLVTWWFLKKKFTQNTSSSAQWPLHTRKKNTQLNW